MRRASLIVSLLVAGCSGVTAGEASSSGTSNGTGTGESDGGESSDTGEGESGSTTSGGDLPSSPQACDLFDPHCPEDEKCTVLAEDGYELDTVQCMPIMGDGSPGDPCMAFGDKPGLSGLDDCGDGSICWNVDSDTGQGMCAAFCEGSVADPTCADGYSCTVCGSCVANVCVADCDPLEPEGVCPGQDDLCVSNWAGNGFFCIPGSGDDKQYGEECSYANECAYGLFCANAEFVPGCQGPGCCSPFCDLGQPNTCPGKDQGQACVAWYEQGMAPAGFENLGACAIPP